MKKTGLNIREAWTAYSAGEFIFTTKIEQAQRIASLLHGRKADYTLKVGKHHALLIHRF